MRFFTVYFTFYIIIHHVTMTTQNTTDVTTALFKTRSPSWWAPVKTKSVQWLTCYLLTLLGPFYMEKSCLGQGRHPLPAESTLASVYMRKKLTLCPSQELASQWQQCSSALWSSRLDQVAQAGRLKVFISKKGDPARRVTLLAEPAFCFSCKRFVKFCKAM